MKSDEEISKCLKTLRGICESSQDATEVRLAQAMETAIQWTTGAIEDFDELAQEARDLSQLLKQDLKLN